MRRNCGAFTQPDSPSSRRVRRLKVRASSLWCGVCGTEPLWTRGSPDVRHCERPFDVTYEAETRATLPIGHPSVDTSSHRVYVVTSWIDAATRLRGSTLPRDYVDRRCLSESRNESSSGYVEPTTGINPQRPDFREGPNPRGRRSGLAFGVRLVAGLPESKISFGTIHNLHPKPGRNRGKLPTTQASSPGDSSHQT